jgi:hypothetical protein
MEKSLPEIVNEVFVSEQLILGMITAGAEISFSFAGILNCAQATSCPAFAHNVSEASVTLMFIQYSFPGMK